MAASLITLGNGRFTLVDADDYEWLNEMHWHYERPPRCFTGYVVGQSFMHRAILGRHGLLKSRRVVDHSNGWGLDNRKYNLRSITHGENIANNRRRGIRQDGTEWMVSFRGDTLGPFVRYSDAVQARSTAEANLGWLTTLDRHTREQELANDLAQLHSAGILVLIDSTAARFEDRYHSVQSLNEDQDKMKRAAARKLWIKIRPKRELQNKMKRQKRAAKLAEYRKGERDRRRAGSQRLKQQNSLVYFHKTRGWLARTTGGEIEVASRQAGLDLFKTPSDQFAASSKV